MANVTFTVARDTGLVGFSIRQKELIFPSFVSHNNRSLVFRASVVCVSALETY